MSDRKQSDLVRESDLLRPPYKMVKNPNLTTVDWDVPAEMVCCKIRSTAAGTLYADTVYCPREQIKLTTFDEMEVRATRLYSIVNGTTAGMAAAITVLGQHVNDLKGRE